ncbi:related to 5-oxoprolinase [Melanopsichium pennsylvanicum]|uniref:Related to 5-oxoprolinase n=2 Tax=Melanopsichium pennsylvanicum TaxID=63383 RepID=A0AAJ4XQ45_9BASI|nr:related to 5-oxoprolinase [Melanopsichium pennsylvanicum 4]SNX85842.1 related to 5-oxoprolinase [Melanopsichium pennsylvanicum]
MSNRIQIAIDRGGTFTDCLGRIPGEPPRDIVIKLLSHDPQNYPDAPTEGVRRILEHAFDISIPRATKIDTSRIDYIRLSTTVATNALLERTGERHALVITKGFKDLIQIGNQSRPKIFDLAIQKPEVLYQGVLEVDERVTLVGYTSDPNASHNAVQFDLESHKGDYATNIAKQYSGTDHPPSAYNEQAHPIGPPEIVRGISGEAVAILKKPNQELLKKQLSALYHEHGYRSLAIVLMHSYTYPAHENLIASIAKDVGFPTVSCSSSLMPMIKIVPRATSSTADAYLTPVLQTYIDGFFSGFQDSLRDGSAGTKVEFMMSDGGLTSVDHFSGLKSIISGPAGGVVGMALTSYDKQDKRPIIGFDMGGTSTDVSRYAGSYEHVFETTLDGITIQSPQLDVNTVASGGSSRLFFRNGLFAVGPESASAHPGPRCYRKGGPLAITDANLVTGRLAIEMFPRIFGPNENQGLDSHASQQAFDELTKQINKDSTGDKQLSVDEVAQGFIKVANEIMCRPIRALTEARGYSASKHILACFGGAGGQHACSLARSLGIRTVIIHKYSSILSAYGMALADRVFEHQEPASYTWDGPDGDARKAVEKRVESLKQKVSAELEAQGFKGDRVKLEVLLNLRYQGTDTALMTSQPRNEVGSDDDDDGGVGGYNWDFEKVFVENYKQEFGFVLQEKNIIVDDIRVRGVGKSFDSLGKTVLQEYRDLFQDQPQHNHKSNTDVSKVEKLATRDVYFDAQGRLQTPIIHLNNLKPGSNVEGPIILVDETQTILIEPNCTAALTSQAVVIDILYE